MGSSGSSLYVIGSNSHGQLGIPTTHPSSPSSPVSKSKKSSGAAADTEIPHRVEINSPATHVAAGFQHTAVLLSNGSILTFGSNIHGELGHRIDNDNDYKNNSSKDNNVSNTSSTGTSTIVEQSAQLVHFPKNLHGNQPITFIEISCGTSHTAAIAEDGTCYTWGSNQNGRLGRTTASAMEEQVPGRVQVSCGLASLSCGASHTAACSTSSGRCFTWGLGIGGRLGHSNERDQHFPTVVEDLSSFCTHRCAAGGHHTLVLVSSTTEPLPTVYSFGGGSFGKLGHGSTTSSNVPLEIVALSPSKLIMKNEDQKKVFDWIVWISAGSHHCCAVSRQGTLFTWGQGNQGRLGHDDNDDVHVPRPIGNQISVLFADCGAQQTCIISETGEMYVFGLSRLIGITKEVNEKKSNANGKNHQGNMNGLMRGGNSGGNSGGNGNGNDIGQGRKNNLDAIQTSILKPTRMQFFDKLKLQVSHVACGATHTVIVTRPLSEKTVALAKMVVVRNMFDKRAFVKRKSMTTGNNKMLSPSLLRQSKGKGSKSSSRKNQNYQTNQKNGMSNSLNMPPLPALPSLLSSLSASSSSSSLIPASPSSFSGTISASDMSSNTSEGMLVSSISQQLQTLQKENEAQRRRLALVERQKEDMIKTMYNMQAVSLSKDGTLEPTNNKNIERTLAQLDTLSTEFQSESIQQFLSHIKRVVGSLHEQLMDTRKEMKEVKATNAVLRVCLEKSMQQNEKVGLKKVTRVNKVGDAIVVENENGTQ